MIRVVKFGIGVVFVNFRLNPFKQFGAVHVVSRVVPQDGIDTFSFVIQEVDVNAPRAVHLHLVSFGRNLFDGLVFNLHGVNESEG
jgi:hypothetical protein